MHKYSLKSINVVYLSNCTEEPFNLIQTIPFINKSREFYKTQLYVARNFTDLFQVAEQW